MPPRKGEKSLLGVFIDREDSLGNPDNIYTLTKEALKEKWVILERPYLVKSDRHTHGLLLADILLYIKLAQHLREGITTSYQHEIEKYEYTKELISYVSKIEC